MAMLGKPVLVASKALYEHGSQIFTVRSKEALPGMLERCLQASTDREIQREAFRLAYYYIFACELPFPAVTVLGLYRAELNYRGPEDLAPGKDISLDHICSFLTKGSPLFDSPSAGEQSRTTADEDAFFDELARSPDYLRDFRYERRLKLQRLTRSTRDIFRNLPFGIGDALLDLGRPGWQALLGGSKTGEIPSPQRRRSSA
jgi:hypothetical protein